MKTNFFQNVQNGAQTGRIYGDNATLAISWPVHLINVLCVGFYRGEDDWKHDDLDIGFYIHKVLSIPFQIVGVLIGALIGAISALVGKEFEVPKNEQGGTIEPIVDRVLF